MHLAITLSHAFVTTNRPPEVISTAFRAPPPNLRSASLMEMGFAITGPLARRSRLLFGFCSSARTFAPRFLPTPPRNDALRFANPSPPSGWVEDFHLLAVEHARHTGGRRHWFVCLRPHLPACDPSHPVFTAGNPLPGGIALEIRQARQRCGSYETTRGRTRNLSMPQSGMTAVAYIRGDVCATSF